MTKFCLQTAFITGRSRPGNVALSPMQRIFIESLSTIGPVTVNFPWTPQPEPFMTTGLLRASVNNTLEYLNSRRPAFVQRYREAAIELLEAAEHTLLLSGSCGLELFNNLQLPMSLMPRVSIFAYGPVARRRPDCRHLLVQGQQDLISRFWFSQADESIACGHMDYLQCSELVTLCKGFINKIHERNG
ncbi:hypothetical protein Z042_00920 [Chania multitudinisentens RB-25]|uniref:Alpha/beta hydrolase n=1 Tax=Chania multitudinisentens RB-25 TaxID=1441930 RepID=W0L3W5_9GAMM|nr:hypothetical protein [Chania multitudinisentens]AHG18366.1 hypothetical protein Z042_00920 [Chania multitudinisentens RB-25]